MIRALGVLLLLAGCAPDLEALSKDPAALCIKTVTIWVSTTIDRNWGCEAQSVTVTMPPADEPAPAPARLL